VFIKGGFTVYIKQFIDNVWNMVVFLALNGTYRGTHCIQHKSVGNYIKAQVLIFFNNLFCCLSP